MQTTPTTSKSSLIDGSEAYAAGVSWSAVIAGGVVSAALALILLALGTGVGLSSVSLWSGKDAPATAITAGAILWLIFMQIVSSSMGGYLAGRLRTRWTTIHTDEVYFRDTAHGFLSWALATVVAAAFLATAATALMGSAPSSAPEVQSGSREGLDTYFVDSLFRADAERPEAKTFAARAEATAIFAMSLKKGELSSSDKLYLTRMVARTTGLNADAADQRVSSVFENAKQSADSARKALAHSLLWAFLALLVGAFCASFSATIGGRQRDHVLTI